MGSRLVIRIPVSGQIQPTQPRTGALMIRRLIRLVCSYLLDLLDDRADDSYYWDDDSDEVDEHAAQAIALLGRY
jgi:hypothetical protein